MRTLYCYNSVLASTPVDLCNLFDWTNVCVRFSDSAMSKYGDFTFIVLVQSEKVPSHFGIVWNSANQLLPTHCLFGPLKFDVGPNLRSKMSLLQIANYHLFTT